MNSKKREFSVKNQLHILYYQDDYNNFGNSYQQHMKSRLIIIISVFEWIYFN